MRRALTALFLIAIAAAAAWTVVRWNPAARNAPDPWRAVPDQAAAIIEWPAPAATWDRFTHTSLQWAAWEKEPWAGALGRILERLLEPSTGSSADAPLLAALVRIGPEESGLLFIGSAEALEATRLGTAFGLDAAALAQLREGAIAPSRPDTALPLLHVALSEGLWLASAKAALVDEALLQLRSGKAITGDSLFAKARATLGPTADAHVLLRTGRALNLLSAVFPADRLEALELPDGWAALDARNEPDAFLLGGLFLPAGPSPMLAAMQRQGNGAADINRVLPDRVSQFEVWRVSDAAAERLAGGQSSDEALFPWVHGEAGIATAWEGDRARRWLVLGAADAGEAMDALEAACAGRCDTISYRGIRMTRTPEPWAAERLLGRRVELPRQPWWALLGRHAVMSDEADAVRAAIDAWNDGTSLAEDCGAQVSFRQMGREAAATWWCDTRAHWPVLAAQMKPEADAGRIRSAWEALGSAFVQIAPAQHGFTLLTIGLQLAPARAAASKPGSSAWWVTDVGAPVRQRPTLVANHVNGTHEAMVQDTLNRLHLLSAAGQVLWTRQLDGPLLGEAVQVDRFRNGKLQLLLGTATRIYLIDRNGKDVGGFPMQLPARASAPLAALDYDGQRDYRVLVPLADGRLANLELSGAWVTGWAPAPLPAPAIAPVRHLRIRGKDYLLAIDGDGGIHLLDRKGQPREAITARLARIESVQDVVPGGDLLATRIRWRDLDLAMHESSLAGASSAELLPGNGACRLLDIDGDGTAERIRMAGDSLVVQRDTQTLWAGTLPSAVARGPAAVRVDGLPWLAVALADGRATLYDLQGHLLPAGYLPGAQPPAAADLNADGTTELVTVLPDGRVAAYRTAGP
jgi:hypothetical protein